MTLLEIFPSLRATTVPRLDPAVWPTDTHYDHDGRIALGAVALADVADQFKGMVADYIEKRFGVGEKTAAE